jgi:hypothetical protein
LVQNNTNRSSTNPRPKIRRAFKLGSQDSFGGIGGAHHHILVPLNLLRVPRILIETITQAEVPSYVPSPLLPIHFSHPRRCPQLPDPTRRQASTNIYNAWDSHCFLGTTCVQIQASGCHCAIVSGIAGCASGCRTFGAFSSCSLPTLARTAGPPLPKTCVCDHIHFRLAPLILQCVTQREFAATFSHVIGLRPRGGSFLDRLWIASQRLGRHSTCTLLVLRGVAQATFF